MAFGANFQTTPQRRGFLQTNPTMRKTPTGSDDESLGKFISSDFGPLRRRAHVDLETSFGFCAYHTYTRATLHTRNRRNINRITVSAGRHRAFWGVERGEGLGPVAIVRAFSAMNRICERGDRFRSGQMAQ